LRREENINLRTEYDKLKVLYDDLQNLTLIFQKITSKLNANEIIKTVYSYINKLMDASGFGIGIYNDDKEVISYSEYIEKSQTLPYDEESLCNKNSLSVWCFTHQKQVFINDYEIEASSYVNDVSGPDHGELPESLIYLPLTTHVKKIGVITVQSFKKNAYTKYHLNLLKNIAAFASIALENAEIFKQIETLSFVASKTINFVIIINKNDRIEWVNKGFTKLTEYTFKEAKGKKT
jgi:transcriptional regulator with GAF, ATPase, and Fis domain